MKDTETSHIPPALPTHSIPPLSKSSPCHTFITINVPTMTHYYHSKSIVYITVHPWCYTFCEFCQRYNGLSTIIGQSILFIFPYYFPNICFHSRVRHSWFLFSFPWWVLESAPSPEALFPFSEKWYLGTKIWDLGVLTAVKFFCFYFLSMGQIKNIKYIYTALINVNVSISIYHQWYDYGLWVWKKKKSLDL